LRRQGEFIIPEYVEGVIAEHPDVSDVCVFGIKAASGAPGESDLVAAIVPVEDRDPNIKRIFDHCRARLERNSVPSYIQVVTEIPKTASEKNLGRLLQETFEPEADDVHPFESHR
jgi:crotonobetaine/carnitine-CoA ligase